jgi:hypothetical protein
LDVRHLVCGARGEDAERIGFDEGVKPSGWVRSLEDRGSFVAQDVLREEAASVLQQYTDEGVIYNGRQR